MKIWGRVFLGLLCVCVIAFLAVRGSPYLAELPWIPRWLAEWADRHGVLRNVPAFGALYLALVALVGARRRIGVLTGVVVLALSVELVQLTLPGRSFDMWDIVASGGGALAGYAVHSVMRRALRAGDPPSRGFGVTEKPEGGQGRPEG